MGWNEVTTTAVDIKKEVGKVYAGTYHGFKEIETKIGPQVIWNFTSDEGVPFGIYGFTNLNRAMESLAPGAVVKITYNGTQNVKTKYGMKDVHQCTVQVWSKESDEESDLPF